MISATMTRMNFARNIVLALTICGPVSLSRAQTTNDAPAPYDHLFQNDQDKISYAIGAKYANDVAKIIKHIELDDMPSSVMRGFTDRFAGTPKITDAQVQEILDKYQSALPKMLSDKHHKEGDDFRAAYRQTVGVTATDSGVLYKHLSGPEKGRTPGSNDLVTMNFKTSLVDGTLCDSSAMRGGPVTVAIDAVIPGWTEALRLMPVGAKWEVVIPPELAYAERGMQPGIGPGSTLVYEIELLDSKPPAPKLATTGDKGSPIVMVPGAEEIKRGMAPKILTQEEVDAMTAAAAKTNGKPAAPTAR